MMDFLCTLTGSCVRFHIYARLSMHAYRSGGNKACQKCEAGAYRSPEDNTIDPRLTVHSLLLFSPFYNINCRNTSNSTEFCRWEGL